MNKKLLAAIHACSYGGYVLCTTQYVPPHLLFAPKLYIQIIQKCIRLDLGLRSKPEMTKLKNLGNCKSK